MSQNQIFLLGCYLGFSEKQAQKEGFKSARFLLVEMPTSGKIGREMKEAGGTEYLDASVTLSEGEK